MIIDNLRLVDFRNYSELNIQFSPSINFITGSNGSGKTNIIEAISILSNLKSFRNAADSDIIKWKSKGLYCSGNVSDSEYRKFELGILSDGNSLKKKIKIDDNDIKKISDYYGRFLTVIFSPSDINIINGTPDLRRRYFDSVISKIFPEYIDELNRFKAVLNSRNSILKRIRENLSDIKELDVWDRLYAEISSIILKKRESFIDQFNRFFLNVYSEISGEDKVVSIDYTSSLNSSEFTLLFNELIKKRRSDIGRGLTTSGPQRDDYILKNSTGLDFIRYASQGQKRTAAVALKIAEFEIIKNTKNIKSVILVDDIFSELDEKRRYNMLDLLTEKGQLIFTMVNSEITNEWKKSSYKNFMVQNGLIIKEEYTG
jgi:DNA replication and repair protein RecF